MLLRSERSLCDIHQTIIVSKDKRESRVYRAVNPDGMFEVRHYRLDGEIVKNQTCCDFLLLNDTKCKAYYIELKGSDVEKAVKQVEAGENRFRSELPGYISYFRIVTSRTPTHNLMSKIIRNLQSKYGADRVKCKTQKLEETLK